MVEIKEEDIRIKTGDDFKPYLKLIPHLSIQEAEKLKYQIVKDRQIVKRLEEKLKEWEKPIKNNDDSFYDLEFIQRIDKLIRGILEGK